MSLNQFYKKDIDSVGDSVSPGLSQEDGIEGAHYRNGEDEQSLVDLFIQNSRPDDRHSHREMRTGPGGPMLALNNQDQLYFQPPTGEHSQRQPGSRRNLANTKPGHRASGSFTHASRERVYQDKQKKIDNFMERQNAYETRKEKNLKKLTKHVVNKERKEPTTSVSHLDKKQKTPRCISLTQNQPAHSRKKSHNSSRATKSSKLIAFDSFEGVKDAVANKMHCDPHCNLAMQSLRFPTNNQLTQMEQQQYLTSMNTHPLLINTNPSGQFAVGQQQNTQFMISPVAHQVSVSQFPAPMVGDYYKTAATLAPQIARPNSLGQLQPIARVGSQGAIGGGRPIALGAPMQNSMAFGAAVLQEEVLDEFPVPTNVHVAPKQTDISIQERSFLQMQNAINQSSRYDDLFNNQVLHNAHNLVGDRTNQESQNITGIMMQALQNGPQTDLHTGLGPGMSVTPARRLEGNNTHSPGKRPAQIGINGRAYVSQSCIAQQQQQNMMQMLDVTQVIKGSGSQFLQQKTNSISTLNIQYPMNSSKESASQQLMLALNDQQLFIEGRNSSGPPHGQIAKDIDILDSEFEHEESRQIEAYYRSINKDSDDHSRKQHSANARVKNTLSQPSKKNRNRGTGTRAFSPPAKGYQQMSGRSATERKMGSVKVCISRLDSALRNTQRQSSNDHQENNNSNNQTVNRSQISRDSQRSARQTNAKAVALARQHLKRMSEQKKKVELQRKNDEQRKKVVQNQRKTTRDELYRSNKLTRQFIMVTSLVMQSEDLSEDSIFNYAQYTEFAIRFGLMSERAASEESDERALLYEMWCTLSRVHSDCAFIRVVNLKTVITAILSFPVAIHRNPANMQPKRSQQKATQRRKQQEEQMQRRSVDDQVIQEEGPQEASEDETDSEFREADDLANDVPLENNDIGNRQNELRNSRQPPVIDRSAGKSGYRESSQQSFESSQPSQFGQQNHQQQLNQLPQQQQQQQQQQHQFGNHHQVQKRPSSIIDEYDELRAAENGQLSSPSEGMRHNRRTDQPHQRQQWSQASGSDADDDDEDEQQYFFDQPSQQQQQREDQEVDSYGEEETISQNEYAIDRAHKIGFFVDHYEFCMTRKDVHTVQRRFKLFQRNWREFQKKDLIVKKSVIVDDGATFQPAINKKSERLIRNKEQGNVEFPLSMRSDQKVQRRQKIWQRDLPRGVKSKERIHDSREALEGDRGAWLTRSTENNQASGLPFNQNISESQLQVLNQQQHYMRQHHNIGGDYFTMGGENAMGVKEMRTTTSSFSRGSSQGKGSNATGRGLTTPRLNQRMEQIYQIGRHKMLNRQDQDKNFQDYENQAEDCTFQPKISQNSRQISMRRSCSNEEKPWAVPNSQEPAKLVKNSASQQHLAERMQLSIQKDIQRKKDAQREKQVKNQVMERGGWPKDYDQMQSQNAAKPVFKRYDVKPQQQAQLERQSRQNSTGGFQQAKQQIHQQQRYPLTTNTSTANLKVLSPPQQPQDRRQTQQVPYGHEEQEQLGLGADAVTPIKEFATETQRHERGQERYAPQTMLHHHHANSTQQAAVAHDRTPSRTRHGLMQSLETGGIQFSSDEQGRAPLESQSSICQNVQTNNSGNASKNNDAAAGHVIVEDTNHGMTTNITTSGTAQANLFQKAMEDLTVIQETTFEQTSKKLQLPSGHESQGNMNSDYVSQSNFSLQTRKPLLFIEVDTNGSETGGVERIEVFKGDDPRQLSLDFCRKHDYDEGTQIVLQRQIEEKLKRAYDKLQVKMEEKRQNRLAEKFRERQNLKTQKI